MYRSAVPIVVLAFVAGLVLLAFSPIAGSTERASSTDQDASATAPYVEPASPFPLLALWDPSDWRDETRLLQPVDPLTLIPLPDYEPIALDLGTSAGGYIEHAISPDGTTAALVTHIQSETMDPGAVELHIVDLLAWTDTVIAEWPLATGYSSSSDPRFSHDGTHVYWIVRTPGTGERSLTRYDLESEVQTALATLPQDFVVYDHRISPDEATWYVFGAPVQQDLTVDTGYVLGEFAADDARLLIVDLGTGEVTVTIELDGVAAGGVPIEVLEGDGYPLQNTSPGLDWDLAGNRLSIGHAGEGGATVVDLDGGTVLDQFSFDEGASWLDRLAGWLVPTAGAVVRAISYGHAVWLDDAGLLAVSGATERLTEDRQKLEMGEHLPVWAVDIETGEQVWQKHLGGVIGLAAAPDGEHLLAHSASRIFRLDAINDEAGQVLFRLDGGTGDVVKRLDLPGRPAQGKESMVVTDEFIYIRTITESGSEVIVVDPVELSIAGNWSLSGGEPSLYKLIPLP